MILSEIVIRLDSTRPWLHSPESRGPGKPQHFLKDLSFQYAFGAIKTQYSSGHFCNGSDPLDLISCQMEMFRPGICSRVVKSNELTTGPVNRPNIASFGLVAKDTGISEIRSFRGTLVFFADDVIYGTTEIRIFLSDQAVFANPLCPSRYHPPQIGTDISGRHEVIDPRDIDGRGPLPSA